MSAVPLDLAEVVDLARPVVLARERTLPALDALSGLLPGGALQRGAPVAVSGAASVSLALALAAGPSAAGSWIGVVGLGGLGLVAATELGVDPDRLLLVREPPRSSWASVVDALVSAVDVVLLGTGGWAGAGPVRRVVARARDAGVVVISVEAGRAAPGRAREMLGPDVRLRAEPVRWVGLDRGHGHIAAREVAVEVTGRRGADRPRRATLWFVPRGDRVEVNAEPPDGLDLTAPSAPGGAEITALVPRSEGSEGLAG